MHARIRTAKEGWGWLAAGLAIFLRNPPLLTLVVVGYWLIVFTVSAVPTIGTVIATVSIPAFSVSLMNAARDLDHGRPLDLRVLISGFRRQARPLLVLGALYLAASVVVLGASTLADGGLFLRSMVGSHHPTPEEVASGEFLAAAQITLVLMTPVVMAWWYAPVLVAWHDFTPGKALFFSFVACLRNWRPFLTYGACVMFFGGLLPGIVLGLVVGIWPAAAEIATALFALPMVFVLAPTLIASFYVSYREVFAAGDTDANAAADANTAPPDDA